MLQTIGRNFRKKLTQDQIGGKLNNIRLYERILSSLLLLVLDLGACGVVDRALDLRSKGLGFASHCWSC